MDVIVICYNRIETWHSRERAVSFFEDCARNSEGCERDRYMNIYWDLKDGLYVAHDGVSPSYRALKTLGRFLVTDAPDKSRDYGGKIWYPVD